MLSESDDDELQSEFTATSEQLRKIIEKEQLRLLLSEEYDGNNAILTVHAGSGGLDSQDWAEMLLRLFLRWRKGKISEPKSLKSSRTRKQASRAPLSLWRESLPTAT